MVAQAHGVSQPICALRYVLLSRLRVTIGPMHNRPHQCIEVTYEPTFIAVPRNRGGDCRRGRRAGADGGRCVER